MRPCMHVACVFPLAHVAVALDLNLPELPPRQATPQLSHAPECTLVFSPFHILVSKMLDQA